jgi:hypothetical protein
MLATIPRAEERGRRVVNQQHVVPRAIVLVRSGLPAMGIQPPSGAILPILPNTVYCRIRGYRFCLAH